MLKEIPGAKTPWPDINRLLNPEERFEISNGPHRCFLFAPQSSAKLSATFFLCRENEIPFYTGFEITFWDKVWISPRSLNHIHKLDKDNSIVSVEAGCPLQELNASLFQAGCELGLSDWVHSTKRISVGQAIAQKTCSGEILQGKPILRRVIGLEMVQEDGMIAKIGENTLSGAKGPFFQESLMEISKQETVTLLKFQILPIPESRLFLNWSFKTPQGAIDHKNILKQTITSWERLDLIIPENSQENTILLAQISGTKEEMTSFQKICPHIDLSTEEDTLNQLKHYFKENTYQFSASNETDELSTQAYHWIHALTGKKWLVKQLGN